MRSSSSRNQRSKKFRVKQVLQLCLLGAVCIWLLYQLKHSYDKKRVIEERSSKVLDRVNEKQPDFLKLGRKDLPIAEERHSAKETETKEDENEEVEDEEQLETKQKTDNHEGRGAGDDEIDESNEQDQENVDEDGDHEGVSANEEENNKANLLDEEEHEGGSQEAREEHYKRDDASSAVRHDSQSTYLEFGNVGTRNPNEEQMDDKDKENAQRENGTDMEKKDLEEKNETNQTVESSNGNNDAITDTVDSSNDNVSSIVRVGNETLSKGNLSISNASSLGNETGAGLPKLEGNSSVQYNQSELQANSTASKEFNNATELHANFTAIASNNMMEIQNNSTELGRVDGVPLQNETVNFGSVDQRNATISTENATVNTETPKEAQSNLADAGSQQNEKFNTSENGNITQTETASIKGENGDGAKVGSDSRSGKSGDIIQGDSGSSLHKTLANEVREASTDQSTLPTIENEAKAGKGEATE